MTSAMTDFQIDIVNDARALLVLAHGAGAAMDSPFMAAMTAALNDCGIGVLRFEFDYMAARRTGGPRRPPPKVEMLCAAYLDVMSEVIERYDPCGPLLIGGKSLGGRVASMIADDVRGIAGVVCIGYPFHPVGKPSTLRTSHLGALTTPTLIVQGTRDALGSDAEVAGYDLAGSIKLHWLADGDHDLKPRNRSGFSHDDHIQAAAEAIAAFVARLDSSPRAVSPQV
ncbi:MAG: alpha/beta family hydrolase [Pseudomonadota bacterium]